MIASERRKLEAERLSEFERVMDWLHEHHYVIEYPDREDGRLDRAYYGGHTMENMADAYSKGHGGS